MPSVHFWLSALSLASSAAALPSKRQAGGIAQLAVIPAVPGYVDGSYAAQGNAQYFVPFTLGGQTIYSLLDTGSSNLVVFSSDQAPKPCTTNQDVCSHLTYDPAPGSTAPHNLGIPYKSSYVDGSGGSGNLYTDTLVFDDQTINNFEFVYITSANTQRTSVFGVGYKSNEGLSAANQYDNLPLRLVDDNIINAPVFSVWLNSQRSQNPGSLLFGGVDTSKYCGTLQKLPIVPEKDANGNDIYNEFNLNVLAITASNPDTNTQVSVDGLATGQNYVSILDTGANYLDLPQAVYTNLLNLYDGTAPSQAGYNPTVDCKYGNMGLTMDVTFENNFVLSVPLSQLVAPGTAGNQCSFRIGVRTVKNFQQINFGAPLISAAYVVYDLNNNNIYLAQSVFDATASTIVPVTNADGIVVVPDAPGLPCQVVTTTTTTSASSSTTTTSSTMSTTSSVTTTTSTGSSTSSSTGSTSSPTGSTSSATASSTTGQTTSTTLSTTSGTTTTSMSGSSSGSTSSSSTASGQTTSSGTTTSVTGKASSTTARASTSSASSYSAWLAWSTTAAPAKASTVSIWSNWNGNPSNTKTPAKASTGTTWSNWNGNPSTTKTPAKASTVSMWNNWNGNPSVTSKATPAVTSAATWAPWNSQTTQSLSYSTITTTIYVCPASKPNCASSVKTKTVTKTVVPYTTSTIYTTTTVTVTAACPSGSTCNGVYYTTSWTVVPLTTTVCPYTPAATTATWSGVSSAAPASTGSWSGVSTPAASSWSNATPAAASSTWAAATTGSSNGNNWVASYTGGAGPSHASGQVMIMMVALVGSAILMLL